MFVIKGFESFSRKTFDNTRIKKRRKNMKKKSVSRGRTSRYFPGRSFLVLSVLVVVFLFISTTLSSQTEDPRLEALLEIQETLDHGKEVKMRFTFHNRSEYSIWVLRWFTPLEGVAGEIFDIKRDGEAVSYHGILVRRGDPQTDDYILIDAGKSVSTEVDLAESYDFSKVGEFGIEFRSPRVSHVVKKEAEMVTAKRELSTVKKVKISSNKVRVRILGASAPRVAPAAAAKPEEAQRQSFFVDCSNVEEAKVRDIERQAAVITGLIPSCLSSLSASERDTYERWFGTYTATRFSTVLANLNDIKAAFLQGDITYNCSGPVCQSSWLAYVYKGGPVEIFLCPGFWSLPDTGMNSKLDTIIHEVSHEAADTDDWTYGITNCENLANTNAGQAIDNADSYAYFYVDFKCSGSELLVYSLLLLFVILLVEGYRRRRGTKILKEE